MARMKVVQVPKPGASFEIVERDIPQPGPGQVRVQVQACGIRHSDQLTKEGLFQESSIPAFPATKSAASSMPWERGSRSGSQGSMWAWAGTVGVASSAKIAAAEILSCV